jgi:UDP-glucuronate 4-epimerase
MILHAMKKQSKIVLVTGAAGFIGYHLCLRLMKEGYTVVGLDNINSYYDINLKKNRIKKLNSSYKKFKFYQIDLKYKNQIEKLFKKYEFKKIFHLAAQAGVRKSIKFPISYVNNNILATTNLFEVLKNYKNVKMFLASSSSVYGIQNTNIYSTNLKTDSPIQMYAVSKKCTELVGHSYSYQYQIPVFALRFFTVYGPWGRPDMALFKFTKGIIAKKRIDIYNKGKMYRDFTYVEDIVEGISALINKAPNLKQLGKIKNDSLSPVAPFRILNIGNTRKVYLLDFINALEKELGKKAIRNYMPMQKGDVKMTVSDTTLLKKLTGYNPKTNYKVGIKKFLKWYFDYYKI